jgi:hypothetical protein
MALKVFEWLYLPSSNFNCPINQVTPWDIAGKASMGRVTRVEDLYDKSLDRAYVYAGTI